MSTGVAGGLKKHPDCRCRLVSTGHALRRQHAKTRTKLTGETWPETSYSAEEPSKGEGPGSSDRAPGMLTSKKRKGWNASPLPVGRRNEAYAHCYTGLAAKEGVTRQKALCSIAVGAGQRGLVISDVRSKVPTFLAPSLQDIAWRTEGPREMARRKPYFPRDALPFDIVCVVYRPLGTGSPMREQKQQRTIRVHWAWPGAFGFWRALITITVPRRHTV